MGYIGSSTTNNNWYYQSFFADTDYCNLYLSAIINTHFYLFTYKTEHYEFKVFKHYSRLSSLV